MARQQVLNPPVSYISNADMRELFHHNYQVFDVLNGSGDYSGGYNSEQLAVDQVTGGGPLYDCDLIYEDAHPNSGVPLVQIGDFLLMAEQDENPEVPVAEQELCWFKYQVVDILNDMSAESGRFRVEYITDTCVLFGDQAPDENCWNSTGTGGYGGDCDDTRIVVFRELNMPMTIID
ncbi:hypothetical protein OAK92_00825 [Crocinitomicaceae bacterium]|nr:hypothetical protein [Crocinitomicaceae bacterium]